MKQTYIIHIEDPICAATFKTYQLLCCDYWMCKPMLYWIRWKTVTTMCDFIVCLLLHEQQSLTA